LALKFEGWKEPPRPKAAHKPVVPKRLPLTTEEKWAVSALKGAKTRSAKKGRQFCIDVSDVLPLPAFCPIFGVPFVLGHRSPQNPSIDRINSNKGYTPDNVRVISYRANMLRSNATIDEIRAVLCDMEKRL
jgi:hypothetical protein